MNNSLCGTQLKKASSTALQFKDPLYSTLLTNIVLNGCLCCTTIMLNIVTIHALRKTSSLPKPLRLLLLSLAVSDLGVGLLGQPLYVSSKAKELHVQGNSPDHEIRILFTTYKVVLNILCLSSFYTIMALSADRFLAIQKPLRYENIVTRKRVVIVVTSIWLLSTFLALCTVFVLPLNIALVITVIVYTICFLATTWSSYKTYSIVRHHRMQIQAQAQQVAQNSEMVNIASLGKSVHATFCIYLAFWVCYLPNFFISVAFLIHSSRSDIISILHDFSMTLVFLNSSLNPVIYCWKMRHIRHTVMGILRNIYRRVIGPS
ncbi:melanocortin receptor 4-like [Oculina patagonica]